MTLCIFPDLYVKENELKQCVEANQNATMQAECANALGKIYYAKAETIDLALKYFLIAYNLSPKNDIYVNDLSRIYYFIEDFAQAEIYLKVCTNSTLPIRERSICAAKLSSIYKTKESHSESLEYLELAHEIEPDYINYKYALGLKYKGLQNYELSVRSFQDCIHSVDEDISSKLTIANCAFELGSVFVSQSTHHDNITDAVKAYSIAEDFDPANPIYNYNKALLSYLYNDLDNVTAIYLEKCLNSEYTAKFTKKEKSLCANKLGKLYFDGKLKEETPKDSAHKIINYFKIAYELYPDIKYLYNLGSTYFLAGKYKDSAPIIIECKNNIEGLYSKEMQGECYQMFLELMGIFINNDFSFYL